MIQNIKTPLLTLVFGFTVALTMGQAISKNKNELIIGKWTECQEMKLDSLYNCNKKNIIYTFKNNNTYAEDQDFTGQKFNVHGKWILTDTQLTLDPDDTKSTISYPYINPVIWINNDLFYLTGQEGEGGPTVYTYFQRIK